MKLVLGIIFTFICVFAESKMIVARHSKIIGQDSIEYEYIDSMEIYRKDSAVFFCDTTSAETKKKIRNGISRLYENGVLVEKGFLVNGEFDGIRTSYDSSGYVAVESHFDHGEIKKTVYYNRNGQRDSVDRYNDFIYWEGVRDALFYEYKFGLQPPTIFDFSLQTGFTFSGFNFHFELPMPRYLKNYYRAGVVLGTEVGVRGFSGRVGLTPFIDDSWFAEDYFNLTQLTFNASFTYQWEGYEYSRYDITNDRWYVGADADFSYVYGHVRLGAFRMMGPEPNNDWHFTLSLGLSPGILVMLFGVLFGGWAGT